MCAYAHSRMRTAAHARMRTESHVHNCTGALVHMCAVWSYGVMKIAVVNLKGGTGKTLTVMHLAAELMNRQESVFVVDADPQGSALDWANALDWQATAHPKNTIHRQSWLSGVADHVVIDTPPGDLGVATSAMRAADLILIPMQPTGGDFAQFAETAQLVEEVQALTDAHAAVLLTRVVKRTLASVQVREALEPFGVPVLESTVPQAQALAMAYGAKIALGTAYADVLTEIQEMSK